MVELNSNTQYFSENNFSAHRRSKSGEFNRDDFNAIMKMINYASSNQMWRTEKSEQNDKNVDVKELSAFLKNLAYQQPENLSLKPNRETPSTSNPNIPQSNVTSEYNLEAPTNESINNNEDTTQAPQKEKTIQELYAGIYSKEYLDYLTNHVDTRSYEAKKYRRSGYYGNNYVNTVNRGDGSPYYELHGDKLFLKNPPSPESGITLPYELSATAPLVGCGYDCPPEVNSTKVTPKRRSIYSKF